MNDNQASHTRSQMSRAMAAGAISGMVRAVMNWLLEKVGVGLIDE
ncbi:hypothetical protein [Streptomyces rubiginosohelvolus]